LKIHRLFLFATIQTEKAALPIKSNFVFIGKTPPLEKLAKPQVSEYTNEKVFYRYKKNIGNLPKASSW
jgi:hypothetical protein